MQRDSKPRVQLNGQRFGRLYVIKFIGITKHKSVWECRCDCGAIANVRSNNLRAGTTKSCGCLHRETAAQLGAISGTHGCAKRSGRSPEYKVWVGMKQRCCDPRKGNFKYYGGRGIRICERWLGSDGFANFSSDMGPRPKGLTIDRINNDGNYEPSNCKWSTQSEQTKNRRRWGRKNEAAA